MHLDDILLDCQEVPVVVSLVSSQVDEVITEVSVELDTEPIVICAVVVDEKLRCHFWVEQGAEYRIFLSFH